MSSVDPAPKPKITIKKDVVAEEDGNDLPPAGSEAPFNPRQMAGIVDALLTAGIMIMLNLLPGIRNISWLVAIAYLLTRDALPFLQGQSVGKKAMKLRAVTYDGKSLTGNWTASVLRNLSLVIPFLNLIEAFILWQKNEQGAKLRRLGDEWGKTKVVVAEDVPETMGPPVSPVDKAD